MIIITYQICSAESQVLTEKQIKCSQDMRQANEEIAKREAYNGKYVIDSDDQSEPIPTPSSTEALESRVAALESSLLNLA